MELKNGYKVVYEAAPTAEGRKFCATKTIPAQTDAMLISYKNGETYVDLRTYKLLYSDGKHLLASVTGIPASTDDNIVLKNANGEIIFGEVIAPTLTVAAKRTTKKQTTLEEETPVED